MAKIKKAFFCKNCGYESPKWAGKCSSCGEWNTFTEEVVSRGNEKVNYANPSSKTAKTPKNLSQVEVGGEIRIKIKNQELTRVLGGGIVPGSAVLIGGEPGIGKSTLMLQVALEEPNLKTLYVSGEESEQQIKMRAERISTDHANFLLLTETNTQNIIQQALQVKPNMVIVDSIQTLHSSLIDSSPGSISQIRESAGEILRYGKETNTPIFFIGHITKEGVIAGPKILEHMVDTVLQFEGDRNHIYRLLRASKNRFGSTNELGIFEMKGNGLREVTNPSEILISNRNAELSGSAIGATMEGLRPLLIETQALVSTAAYGTPQRQATGFDLRRLHMLLAVLEKRCGFRLAAKDVFLNMAGGLRIDDPAIDLAVVCSILSSSEDIAINPKICLAAEIGLSGEVRPVTRADQRVAEAQKLGFEQIILSSYNKKGLNIPKGIEVIFFAKINDVFRYLFA